jgi:hypothetical protein
MKRIGSIHLFFLLYIWCSQNPLFAEALNPSTPTYLLASQESMDLLKRQAQKPYVPKQGMQPLRRQRSSLSNQYRRSDPASNVIPSDQTPSKASSTSEIRDRKSFRWFSEKGAVLQKMFHKILVGLCAGLLLLAIVSTRIREYRRTKDPWGPDYKVRFPKSGDVWTDVYGKPRYRTADDVVLGLKPAKSFIHRFFFWLFPFFERQENYWITKMSWLRRNMLIFASSGTGKSYFLKHLIFSFLLKGKGGIIVDPAAERAFWQDVQNMARIAGREHQVFSVDLGDPNSPSFGLLSKMPGDDPLSHANRFCDAIDFKSSGSSDSQHYINIEKNIADVAIHYLFNYYKDGRDYTPKDIYDFVADEQFRNQVIQAFEGEESVNEIWKRYRSRPAKEMEKEASNILAKLQPFLHEPLNSIFNNRRPDLNFRRISEENLFVVFRLSAHAYPFDIGNIGKMIVSNIGGMISYRNKIESRTWDDFILIIDEFASFAPASFIDVLPYNRKAGVCIILAMQDLAQLEKLRVHNTKNIQIDLMQACRTQLTGAQRDGDEARRWSNRTPFVRIVEPTERVEPGIFRRVESITRIQREVRKFHPNFFMNMKDYEMFIDLNEEDPKDIRGQRSQGPCKVPELVFLGKPLEESMPDRSPIGEAVAIIGTALFALTAIGAFIWALLR